MLVLHVDECWSGRQRYRQGSATRHKCTDHVTFSEAKGGVSATARERQTKIGEHDLRINRLIAFYPAVPTGRRQEL